MTRRVTSAEDTSQAIQKKVEELGYEVQIPADVSTKTIVVVTCPHCTEPVGTPRVASLLNWKGKKPCGCTGHFRLPKCPKERLELVKAKCQMNGLILVSANTQITKGKVVVACPHCNKPSSGTRMDHFLKQDSVRGCGCVKVVQQPGQQVQTLAQTRKHQILKIQGFGPACILTVKCLKHNHTFTVKQDRYLKFDFVAECCIRAKHQRIQRQFKKLNLKRLQSLKARTQRQAQQGSGVRRRRWRGLGAYKRWLRNVSNFYQKHCKLTGLALSKKGKSWVQVHHLWSGQHFPQSRYLRANGITLLKPFHLQYHGLIKRRFFLNQSLLVQQQSVTSGSFGAHMDVVTLPTSFISYLELLGKICNQKFQHGSENTFKSDQLVLQFMQTQGLSLNWIGDVYRMHKFITTYGVTSAKVALCLKEVHKLVNICRQLHSDLP